MKKLNRVGEKYITNEGYNIEIIEYISKRNITVMFDSGYKVKVVGFSTILKGKIRNPYHKSVLGVGYFGVGKYKSSINNVSTKVYKDWLNMLQRGYNQQYKEKHPTYKGIIVCEEWHNFQVFAKWHEENYIDSLEPKETEEKEIPITYGLIKASCGWSRFAEVCDKNVYAINEWGDYEPNEVFYITESQAKQLNFI